LQPHVINNLEAKFGQEVCNKRVYKTAGTTRFKIVCPAADDDVIEAEYVAMSEVVKEVKFIHYLLRDIGIEVKLPIIVKTDNVGAMFMAKNSSSRMLLKKSTKGTFLEEYIKGSLMAGVLEISFAFKPISDKDIH
jgi:hypothetical protein